MTSLANFEATLPEFEKQAEAFCLGILDPGWEQVVETASNWDEHEAFKAELLKEKTFLGHDLDAGDSLEDQDFDCDEDDHDDDGDDHDIEGAEEEKPLVHDDCLSEDID